MESRYFIDWENEVFGYSYGTGEEEIIPAVREFLNLCVENKEYPGIYNYSHETIEKGLGKLPAWLLINVLCRADIIEYGTSPRFGWLTDKGTLLRKYMLSKTVAELLDVLDTDETYVHCYKNVCNCKEIGKLKCNNPFF